MFRHSHLIKPLSRICGCPLHLQDFSPLGGGSINEVFRVSGNNDRAFVVKVNSASKFPQLFAQEARGLAALQPFVKTPDVIGWEIVDDTQFLVLAWIATEPPTPTFWKNFGAALAHLHTNRGGSFGSFENNYMGSVPQDNSDAFSWAAFFAQRRLMPMAKRCIEKGLLGNKEMAQIERLCEHLPQLFSPAIPTMLHGDLWSGNFLCGNGAQPILIDPAVYYGHPAIDLGMTTLFGGFDPLFYEAYNYHNPLPAQHKEDWELCNLYPLLIHLLLFGRSYLGAIQRTLQRFAGTQHRIV